MLSGPIRKALKAARLFPWTVNLKKEASRFCIFPDPLYIWLTFTNIYYHVNQSTSVAILQQSPDRIFSTHYLDSRRQNRSEEPRVGNECFSTCRSRWSPYH